MWLWVRNWILWVAHFRFPFSEICVQNQWWYKLLRSSWGLRHWPSKFNNVMMEYLHAFQYWYCELCLENRWDRKHCFVNFCSLAVLEFSVDKAWWEWGRKSYLGPAEIVSFSNRSFSHLNQIWFKCETRLLFFLIIFYNVSFDQQSPADVLQNRCS